MSDVTGMEIADHRLVAFGLTVVVASAVYAGFQLAVDGQLKALETAAFAVSFGVVLVGFEWLMDRYLE